VYVFFSDLSQESIEVNKANYRIYMGGGQMEEQAFYKTKHRSVQVIKNFQLSC
jgi:hypothetical protein